MQRFPRILDIGAGNGSLGRLLFLQGRSVIVDGIEPNRVAASIASPFYREMHIGFLYDFINSIDFNRYDYIVLADVIEHIENPQIFLRQLISVLGSGVTLLVSMPNIAFGAVRLSLARGEFQYVDSGILERTHLRFFTHETAINLFKSEDLNVNISISLCRSFYRSEFKRSSLGFPGINLLRYAFMIEARAYQYLFCLARDPNKIAKRVVVGATSFDILFDSLFNWDWSKRILRVVRNNWWRLKKSPE